jgi:hypothetical protein
LPRRYFLIYLCDFKIFPWNFPGLLHCTWNGECREDCERYPEYVGEGPAGGSYYMDINCNTKVGGSGGSGYSRGGSGKNECNPNESVAVSISKDPISQAVNGITLFMGSGGGTGLNGCDADGAGGIIGDKFSELCVLALLIPSIYRWQRWRYIDDASQVRYR